MRIHVRTVGPFQANCYLVIDEIAGRCVLIDPGAEGAALADLVREGAGGATLDAIWLTHAHIDHIGGVAELQRQFDVPVHLHPLDLTFYTDLSARMAESYGIPFEQPAGATRPLAEGDELTCGALRFTVMHVPGHAPGQVSFNGEGLALSGDLLFAGSIGRTDLPLSNPLDMEASLERFAALPGDTVVYPGHGDPTTIDAELTSNPFLDGRARVLRR